MSQLERARNAIGPLEGALRPHEHDMELTGASSDSVQAQFINEPTAIYAATEITSPERADYFKNIVA